MRGGPERTGLWSSSVTVGRIVIDPVDVLLDLAAAERALWSWWAGRLGVPAEEAVAAAQEAPLPDVVRRLRERAGSGAEGRGPSGGPDEVSEVRARREQLHRLVRRRRGASSLLRSIPSGRVAVWTTLSADELAFVESRARLTLPPARLCGLAVTDDARATAFLTDQGDEPSRWLALESHAAGAARSERLGCRVVLVRPEAKPGRPGAAQDDGTRGPDLLTAEDPALLSVTPSADGLTVGVRRQARLRPGA